MCPKTNIFKSKSIFHITLNFLIFLKLGYLSPCSKDTKLIKRFSTISNPTENVCCAMNSILFLRIANNILCNVLWNDVTSNTKVEPLNSGKMLHQRVH